MPETDRPAMPVVIKKYANRRLYDTESSIYITLDSLAAMVRQNRDFVVFDAKTGDDITRSVLTQIIVEEETKGRNMLPTMFLRQLIGFYGDSMQGLVPGYLEQVMEQFAAQQRHAVSGRAGEAAGQTVPAAAEAPNTERARGPSAAPHQGAETEGAASGEALQAEIRALRAEVERLGRELARSTASGEAPAAGDAAGRPGGQAG